MINSKNYLPIVIPYLLICCSLYHLTYWSVFDINGLSLISVSNLVKSAVQPILISFIGTTIALFLVHKFFNKKLDSFTAEAPTPSGKEGWVLLGKVIGSLAIFSFVVWLLILWNPYGKWQIILFMLGNLFYIFIKEDVIFSAEFKPHFQKSFLLMFMIYFPCFSIGAALEDADKIQDNKHYLYTVSKTFTNTLSPDTLKLLGTTDEYFIFLSLDNKKRVFIKSDTINLLKK